MQNNLLIKLHRLGANILCHKIVIPNWSRESCNRESMVELYAMRYIAKDFRYIDSNHKYQIEDFQLSNISSCCGHKLLVTICYEGQFYEVICDAIINFNIINPIVDSSLIAKIQSVNNIDKLNAAIEWIKHNKYRYPYNDIYRYPYSGYNVSLLHYLWNVQVQGRNSFISQCQSENSDIKLIIDSACLRAHLTANIEYDICQNINAQPCLEALLNCYIYSIEVLYDEQNKLDNIIEAFQTRVLSSAFANHNHINHTQTMNMKIDMNKKTMSLYYSEDYRIRTSGIHDECTATVSGKRQFPTRYMLSQFIASLDDICAQNNIQIKRLTEDDFILEKQYIGGAHMWIDKWEKIFNITLKEEKHYY